MNYIENEPWVVDIDGRRVQVWKPPPPMPAESALQRVAALEADVAGYKVVLSETIAALGQRVEYLERLLRDLHGPEDQAPGDVLAAAMRNPELSDAYGR